MVDSLRLARLAGAVAVLATPAGACGPSSDVTVSGSGTGSSESSSGSSGNPACPDVYEGNLEITDDTDLEPLRTVRRVTGSVLIVSTSLVDVSFFECLEQIDQTLLIRRNDLLVDLRGLESLEFVAVSEDFPGARGLLVDNNASLESLAGLDRLQRVPLLSIIANKSLSHLALGQLREVERLELGTCYEPSETPPGFSDSALTEIDGLESLERINSLVVGGQNQLVSLGALHGTLMGATGGLEFYYNANLPYSEIEQVFESAYEGTHCGNEDDPVDLCNEGICPGPD